MAQEFLSSSKNITRHNHNVFLHCLLQGCHYYIFKDNGGLLSAKGYGNVWQHMTHSDVWRKKIC